MTYLLLQTFLLLLAAYFAGAFTACLAKRWLASREGEPRLAPVQATMRVSPQSAPSAPMQPMSPTAAAAAAAARATQIRPQLQPAPRQAPAPRIEYKPRSIELVQPKIDLLPRPAPRPAPAIADTSRFERALTGPDPNEGAPRVPIQQIYPAVFTWVTGPPGPWPPPKPPPPPEPEPVPEPEPEPMAAPVVVAPEPVKPVAIAAAPKPKIEPAKAPVVVAGDDKPRQGISAAAANAAAAASAAMAAARAAAAAIGTSRTTKSDDAFKAAQAAAEQKPAEEKDELAKTVEPAAPRTAPAIAATRPPEPAKSEVQPPRPATPSEQPQPASVTEGDDLQRIRAINGEIEQALKRQGVTRFETIARWTADDLELFDDELKLSGRIEREQWVEQAQILAKGGETYYSRNRAAAARAAAAAAPSAQPSAVSAPATIENSQPAKTEASPPTSEQPRVGQGRSVAEIAAAAAAAIAAASASVTRGIRPIEPTSPMSKADRNIVIPTKLTVAIKEQEAKDADVAAPRAETPLRQSRDEDDDQETGDDLKRIRGVGVLIEKRLKTMGVATYEAIANWTIDDIDRVSQTLDFKGRIEREGWVEQARILSSGGDTEFSRRVDRGEVETSKDG